MFTIKGLYITVLPALLLMILIFKDNHEIHTRGLLFQSIKLNQTKRQSPPKTLNLIKISQKANINMKIEFIGKSWPINIERFPFPTKHFIILWHFSAKILSFAYKLCYLSVPSFHRSIFLDYLQILFVFE